MSTTLQPGEHMASAVDATVAPRPRVRERLLSLDVFRGMTIAGMLLVNNPGTWSAIYPPLAHAKWHGWTPTDLIFPFFLFIVGITTHLSLTSRRQRGAGDREVVTQILRRGGMIVLCGLFLSGFPFSKFALPLPFGAQFESNFGLATWRFTGVLQRIGIVYICTALLTLRTSLKQQGFIIAALLLGYWLVMTVIPVPGQDRIGAYLLDQPDATLSAWLDRLVLGNHIWRGSRTWDPEGILSTFPAIGTCMLGVLAGRWIGMQQRPLIERIAALFAVGAIAMMVGLIWHWVFPINKNLWTSSYVVFTAGLAGVTLATCMWLIDIHGVRWWTKPFVWFGVNPLTAFVASGFFSRLIYSLVRVPSEGKMVSAQSALYKTAFASWLAPQNASLLFALCYVLLFLWLMWELYRRDILIKL